MQTSFPFNGENFPPFQSAIDGEKNSPTSLKQEKDLEQPKQVRYNCMIFLNNHFILQIYISH